MNVVGNDYLAGACLDELVEHECGDAAIAKVGMCGQEAEVTLWCDEAKANYQHSVQCHDGILWII